MTFHIQLAEERRLPILRTYKDYVGRYESRIVVEDGEECMEQVMVDADDPAAWVERQFEDRSRCAIAINDQLHMTNCEELNHPNDSNIIGVFEWDQKSPYILQHKGDWSAVSCRGAGWPEITKEQWVSQQADQMGVS